jgi:hypothetical protein
VSTGDAPGRRPFVGSGWFFWGILCAVVVAEGVAAAGDTDVATAARTSEASEADPMAGEDLDGGDDLADLGGGDDADDPWAEMDFEDEEADTSLEQDLAESGETQRILFLVPLLLVVAGLFWRPARGRWLVGLASVAAGAGVAAGQWLAGGDIDVVSAGLVALIALASYYGGAALQSGLARVMGTPG